VITPEQLAASGSEHGHQAAIFCWAQQSGIEELKWLFAVPNGFFGTAAQKSKMKAEGLKSGVPDIWLPVPMRFMDDNGVRNNYCGLVIELKVGKNKPSTEQQEWIDYLNDNGYRAIVCYGWESARDTILMYLGRM
jgi:hypothetical protein